MKKITILDSTLRDGTQGEGISFSVNDKIQITKALDAFGVDYIEVGTSYSNPKDLDFFQKIASYPLSHAKLCAFGSTKRNDCTAEVDSNLQALLAANTTIVSVFGKAWDLHVTEVLKITLEENLALVKDTLFYLKQFDKTVFFDAEHFFDGYIENAAYALSVLKAAMDGGADMICLCDTNGGTMPDTIYDITKKVKERFPTVTIGIHCHNDGGCATANAFLAVKAGAEQVQGTFTGIGERCGNTDLSTLIPNLKLKCGMDCNGNLELLYTMTRQIAEIANTSIRSTHPYIGKSAFAHKAGMHIDGVIKISRSFEHIDPKMVGNERKFLASEVSGRSSILAKIKNFAPFLTKDSSEISKILERLKEMEYFGYQFEGADASFELLVKRTLGIYQPHFKLVLYKSMGEFPAFTENFPASAMIQIEVDGKQEITAALGNGPVNALDTALRKALTVFYPIIKNIHLTDYKVRVLDQNQTTAAKVRVLIETTDGNTTWTTVGVSHDIIEASLVALMDSMEYKLAF